MTRTRPLAATAALLALAAGLPGYERQAYNGQPLHRPTEVWFSVDPSAVPGLKNANGGTVLTVESDPVAALRAAMQAWNTAPGAAVSLNLKVSAARAPALDLVNAISFDDTPAARSVVGSAIAVTMTTYTTEGVIVDSDIIFNPALTFATEPTLGAFDLQAIATHELGHCLGADHSLLRSATMYEAAMPEETSPRYLSSDDIAFAADTYPAGTPPGRVAGSVTFTSGSPVPEALMLAINPDTGFVVAMNSVSGFYAVSGLPPGNYLIAAIPPDSANWQTSLYGGAPPQSVYVTADQTTHADVIVPDGLASMRIDWADFGTAGLSLFCLVPSGGTLNATFNGSGFPDAVLPDDIFIYGGGVSVREEPVESWPGGLSFRADAAARNDWADAVIAVRRDDVFAVYPGVRIAPRGPLFAPSSVTNGASFATGAVAPGEMVSIFGLGLGPEEPLWGALDNSGKLASSLGDTAVDFDGVAAPLFYVSGGQINAQVPFETSTRTSTRLRVRYANAPGTTAILPLAQASPGIFTVVNADGSLNDPLNPAAPGSAIIVYGTGQGVVEPSLETGDVAPVSPLSRAAGATAFIGGLSAEVQFAGMTPGFVALLQLNVVIPPEAPDGQAELSFAMRDEYRSNTRYIWVRR